MRKKRYYLIGIGGVAMASLAGLLKARGYDVAGSDQGMYEPMKSMLKRLKIKVFAPYSVFHMKHFKPDMVVVGNAVGRGNPEVEYMLSIGQPYRSMSDILLKEFIEGKKAIIVTGTHGKTTTTALVSWILECAKLDPTVFIGGIDMNLNSSFKLGKGKYVVIEGDEYDTAFFDKSPKFWHYRPLIGVVNNIELDHVDIYPDLEAYKYAFERFINLIPENGLLIANRYDKNVMELVDKAKAEFHVKYFGAKGNDYVAQNISAAVTVAKFLKIPMFHVKRAIASFKGVKRRSEIIGVSSRGGSAFGGKDGITVIDDYAHHPTAVRQTLDAIRQNFVKHRLFLMFEPGSASAKRRVFEKQYIEAFRHADIVYIYKPYKASSLKPNEVFHVKHVVSALHKKGIPAKSFDRIEDLLFHVKRDAKPSDVIVIMSCRGFDGLRERILEVL